MEYPKWAEPAFPFVSKNSAVFFFVPDVEMPVEIEFDPEEEIPRYRAGVITNENPLDDKFKKNYPHRRGINTPSGHILIFDDKDGDWLEEIVRDKVVKIMRDWLVEVIGKTEVKASKMIFDSPHTECFWKCYAELPMTIRKRAKEAYRQFQTDPYYSPDHKHRTWGLIDDSFYDIVAQKPFNPVAFWSAHDDNIASFFLCNL
jgi:hypothetical protein